MQPAVVLGNHRSGTTGEAATGLLPRDAEGLGSDRCRLDVASSGWRDEVHHGVVVFSVQSVREQSKSLTCTLLVPRDKVWRPLEHGGSRVGSEGVTTTWFTEDCQVVCQEATAAERVSAQGAVLPVVALQTVDEGYGGRQASQERVEKASVAYVLDACVVRTDVHKCLARKTLQG